MKSLALIALSVGLALPSVNHAANWTAGMKEGKLELKSAGPIAFGPEGILLIADTKAEGINQKVAGLLGTSADQILIEDLAVNPISRNTYLAVSRGLGADGTPV